jgi:hypothetical protein
MGGATSEFIILGSAGLIPEIAVKTLALENGALIWIHMKGGTTVRTPNRHSLKIATSRISRNWEMGNAIRRRTTAPNATTTVGIAA